MLPKVLLCTILPSFSFIIKTLLIMQRLNFQLNYNFLKNSRKNRKTKKCKQQTSFSSYSQMTSNNLGFSESSSFKYQPREKTRFYLFNLKDVKSFCLLLEWKVLFAICFLDLLEVNNDSTYIQIIPLHSVDSRIFTERTLGGNNIV